MDPITNCPPPKAGRTDQENPIGDMKMKTSMTMMGLAALITLTTPSFAADSTSGWHFEATPYAWLAGLEGDATVNGTKAEFEKSASDLLDAVDVGASLRLSASYDRLVILGLVDYFSLSTDELDVEDRPAGGRVETEFSLVEVVVGYQLDGWSEGQTFTLGVGVRQTVLDTDLTPVGEATTSKKTELADPMFYVLPSMPMFASKIDGLRFNPVLGVGSGDSEIVYELFPQIQYNFTELVAARLGYRTVGYKFEGDGNDNELNVSLSGLVAGLGIRF